MTDDDRQKPRSNAELEQEIRRNRRFTEREAIARLAGPGAMKGASPVSRLEQAETEIGTWLGRHLADTAGVLRVVLHRQLRGSELLLDNLDKPLIALAGYCQHVLSSDHLLQEIVREADVEWGQRMDERPHFEKAGSPPHPDDPYTIESVRRVMTEAVEELANS
ncbi:MAG TPA: hypothetical protein VFH89_12395 [Sphingomicrobium sp.]|nr:hypothetical protein [Sphingomicrobium sp.]